VLRLRAGSPIIIFNGQGGEYHAILCEIGKRHALAQLEEFCPREIEASLPITLGQCISKTERMDFAIQKATELGVTAIQPLYSERSMSPPPNTRWAKKQAHWQGIISSACEQCGRNRLPLLQTAENLNDWLNNLAPAASKVLLDPTATLSLSQLPPPDNTAGVMVLIGPEGGLSEREIRHAQQCGFTGIRLGSRILRTETAALTVIAAVLTLWGDLA
jgi:16S rRNA (uracil1498-N3)-methyltransferase